MRRKNKKDRTTKFPRKTMKRLWTRRMHDNHGDGEDNSIYSVYIYIYISCIYIFTVLKQKKLLPVEVGRLIFIS